MTSIELTFTDYCGWVTAIGCGFGIGIGIGVLVAAFGWFLVCVVCWCFFFCFVGMGGVVGWWSFSKEKKEKES